VPDCVSVALIYNPPDTKYIYVPKLFDVARQRANMERDLTVHIMQWERQKESSGWCLSAGSTDAQHGQHCHHAPPGVEESTRFGRLRNRCSFLSRPNHSFEPPGTEYGRTDSRKSGVAALCLIASRSRYCGALALLMAAPFLKQMKCTNHAPSGLVWMVTSAYM